MVYACQIGSWENDKHNQISVRFYAIVNEKGYQEKDVPQSDCNAKF